jgi:ankyrin repeat protein
LHAAAVGSPGSQTWNPPAQSATIVCLIEAGADPNAADMDGVSPLHRAVRTRCAEAVRTLLTHGADPTRKNKSGSTPMVLAMHNTGRGGTGLPAAKAQQQEIFRLLQQHAETKS